jgi:Ubiquitin-Binding Zinc Finger
MTTSTALPCPFCHFTDQDASILELHVNTLHGEDESSSRAVNHEYSQAFEKSNNPVPSKSQSHADVEEKNAAQTVNDYVLCPEPDCGEEILASELQSHQDLHVAEKIAFEDMEGESMTTEPHVRHRRRRSKGNPKSDFKTDPPQTSHGGSGNSLHKHDSPSRRRSKHEQSVFDWKAIFKGTDYHAKSSSSRAKRPDGTDTEDVVAPRSVRRLGVCFELRF